MSCKDLSQVVEGIEMLFEQGCAQCERGTHEQERHPET